MVERKELRDHLLNLAKSANQRLTTHKDLVVIPIIGAGAGLTRSILMLSEIDTQQICIKGVGLDYLLSNVMMLSSVFTGMLIGMDLIKERIIQRVIDEQSIESGRETTSEEKN